jgi:DNA-binding response OmpR family regulator
MMHQGFPLLGSGGPLSVLLIEHDDNIALLLRFLFERRGWRVQNVADGRAALMYLRNTATPPDLIVLEIMLPHVDGFEIIRQVRTRADWSRASVIVLTFKDTEADCVRAFAAGADDFVSKPFLPNELLARAARILTRAPRPAGPTRCTACLRALTQSNDDSASASAFQLA